MTLREGVSAYPLSWPTGWPRAIARKKPQFHKIEHRTVTPTHQGAQPYTSKDKKNLSVMESTKRVLAELNRLGVLDGDAIISTNLVLRLDGLPRSDQRRPDDPGVAVYWKRPGEDMRVMAIDVYETVEGNLAAIAATLDAMRAIQRHGGAQILERAFTGFAALPPPSPANRRPAHEVLGVGLGASDEAIKAAYRNLARKYHPDAPGGGDRAKFDEAVDAYQRLTGSQP